MTVGLFLALERRIVEAHAKCLRSEFTTIAPKDFLGTEIMGKTFGQIGMGNIAQRIGHILSAGFGMTLLGYDPFISTEEAAKRGFRKVDTLEELLEQSDLVNINVPLVKSTENMISGKLFDHFKPGAVFVNAARGCRYQRGWPLRCPGFRQAEGRRLRHLRERAAYGGEQAPEPS